MATLCESGKSHCEETLNTFLMKKTPKRKINRRSFLQSTGKVIASSIALSSFPSIVPSSVFGPNAPSNRINVGAIGTGRISRIHDMPGVWQRDFAQIVAVCDVDRNRAAEGRQLVNEYYSGKHERGFKGVRSFTISAS